MKTSYKVGDKCVFDGLVATIEGVDHVAGHPERILLSLVADEDKEMTCTVTVDEVTPYTYEKIDQSERLKQARHDSDMIAARVDGLTDKYIGDCSF